MKPRRALATVVLVMATVSCRASEPTSVSAQAASASSTSTTVPVPATTVPAATATATTTTSITSTSNITSTASAATSTSVPSGDACSEVAADGSPPPAVYSEAAFDRFGPLDPSPSLTVQFGSDRVADGIGLRAVRIEGGVLVGAVRLPTVPSAADDRLPVAAVDHDGTVRWSRCLEANRDVQLAVAAPEHRPRHALVQLLIADGSSRQYRFVQLSLTTGAEQPTFAAAMQSIGVAGDSLARLAIVDATDRYALLVDDIRDVGGTYQHIVRYDLVADAAIDVGVPAELLQAPPPGRCSAGFQASLTSSGDVIVSDLTTDVVSGAAEHTSTGAVVARWQNGAWSSEPSSLADSVGVRPGFACEDDIEDRVLRGVDALGQVRWIDPNLTHPGADDVGWYLDGNMAIGQVCAHRVRGECDRFQLVGLDPATGDVRWTQPGPRLVAGDPADGHVLVWAEVVGEILEPTGWVMLDDRTGREVPGQRWNDPGVFTLYPSREVAGFNRTTRAGGLVLVIDGAELQVWYPVGTGGIPRGALVPDGPILQPTRLLADP